ncbi:MAG TPA: chemotaxis protein CheW [Thermoanaerobaculia bacterium]
MVDLVKIRKKAKRNAGVPPADAAASAPPPAVEEPPTPEVAGEDARGPAGEDAGAPARDATRDATAVATGAAPSKLEKFKEQAGKRREAETAKAEDTATATGLELLTFVIAREQYAVDIERIVEIVTPRPLTRIPNADTSVMGIVSLRGTIVTLVDVRRKLGHPPAGAETPDTRIVVIDNRSEMIGFVVDRVLRVVKTAAGEIEPHPVVHTTELDESIRGVFRVGDALTILLDLDKLLDSRALAASPA